MTSAPGRVGSRQGLDDVQTHRRPTARQEQNHAKVKANSRVQFPTPPSGTQSVHGEQPLDRPLSDMTLEERFTHVLLVVQETGFENIDSCK